jgi:predicted DNA-binding WGR domain protein
MDLSHRAPPLTPVGGKENEIRHFKAYENTTSRYAFWCIWLERHGKKWFCAWRWGKIGSTGVCGHAKLNGRWAAIAHMEDKIAAKESRGYVLGFAGPPFPSCSPEASPPLKVNAPPTGDMSGAIFAHGPVVSIDPVPNSEEFDVLDVLWT